MVLLLRCEKGKYVDRNSGLQLDMENRKNHEKVPGPPISRPRTVCARSWSASCRWAGAGRVGKLTLFALPGARVHVPMASPRVRLLPDEPLPPYSFVPGRFPHPVRDPAGHSFGH